MTGIDIHTNGNRGRVAVLRTMACALLVCALPPSLLGQSHEDWSYNLGIYEVNVRQYTAEGTFDAFATHLDRLQEMGVGILWFMPIHPIGKKNRLGTLGSYYAVQDYLDVNQEFGTLGDFKALVADAHERGMYVLLDWVANHTAWDAVLTETHPEWYVTNDAGHFIPPPGTNWSDVIELDYTRPELRAYMIEAMTFWIEEVGVDGFRFDAVSFVPEDFWREATDALINVKPDVFLLAEGDGPIWHELGFHMSYGWGLYGFESGVLIRVATGSSSAAVLAAYLQEETRTYPEEAYRMYFTSNHDENSWHGTPEELFGDAAETFAVLTSTIDGMPLIYSGQEAGLNRRLAFFDKDRIVWREHPNASLYQRLLDLKRTNPALWNGRHGGRVRVLPTNNTRRVLTFVREKDAHRVLAAFNLTGETQRVVLGDEEASGSYRDVFTGAGLDVTTETELELPAWGYRVFSTIEGTTRRESPAPGTDMRLDQNYPNPFREQTRIGFHLPREQHVELTVSDVLGRDLRLVASGRHGAGWTQVDFSATDLPGGLYVYRLAAEGGVLSRRMIHIR